jgi:hypothetical protein
LFAFGAFGKSGSCALRAAGVASEAEGWIGTYRWVKVDRANCQAGVGGCVKVSTSAAAVGRSAIGCYNITAHTASTAFCTHVCLGGIDKLAQGTGSGTCIEPDVLVIRDWVVGPAGSAVSELGTLTLGASVVAFDTGFAGVFVEADGALPYTLVDVQIDKVAGSVEAATETVGRADLAGFAVGIAE